MSDCLKKQFTTKWLQLVVAWLQILHKIQSDFWPILEKMLASHLVKHKIIIFSPLSFYILFIFFIGNGASYIHYIFSFYSMTVLMMCLSLCLNFFLYKFYDRICSFRCTFWFWCCGDISLRINLDLCGIW